MSPWAEVLLFLAGGLAFVTAALVVSRLIRPNRPNPEKLTPYESGEQPLGTAWVQVSTRFNVIALIFLLFEVEVVFLFPWATVFASPELITETNGAWGWFSFIEMLIFVGILALGLAAFLFAVQRLLLLPTQRFVRLCRIRLSQQIFY